MSSQSKSLYVVIALIFVGALSRILITIPNVSALSTIALLGSAFIFRKFWAFLIPIISLFISDFVINNTIYRPFYTEVDGLVIFQDYMIYTYAAFILVAFVGFFGLRSNISTSRVFGASIIATIIFFLVSNFGVWVQGINYPLNFGGLIACYIAGLPFLLNSLIGNLLFAALFFGLYNWINNNHVLHFIPIKKSVAS